MMQCIDLFLRNIAGYKTNNNGGIYLSVALLLSLVPLGIIGSYDSLGYPGNAPWCIYLSGRQTPKPVLLSFYVPGAIVGLIGTVCIFCVLIRYFQTLRQSAGYVSPQQSSVGATPSMQVVVTPTATFTRSAFEKIAIATGPIMLYNIAFLLTWLVLLYVPFGFLAVGQAVVDTSNNNWITCMFQQLKQTSDASDLSWQTTCGETPYSFYEGVNVDVRQFHDFTTLVLSGQSIVIALVFLPSQLSRLCRSDPNLRRALMRAEVLRDRFRSLSMRYRIDAGIFPIRSAVKDSTNDEDRDRDRDRGHIGGDGDSEEDGSQEQLEAAGCHHGQAYLRASSRVPPNDALSMGLALAHLSLESSLIAAAVGAANDNGDVYYLSDVGDDGDSDDDDDNNDEEDKDKLSSVVSCDDDESKLASGLLHSYHFHT
jgi:hypothetical protein